jgi:hypothetical protein
MVHRGLDWWNHDAYQRQVENNLRHSAALDQESVVLLDHIAQKEHLVDELIAERQSLLETAAQFRRLDRELEEVPTAKVILTAGVSPEEHYCRRVFEWLRVRCESEGEPYTEQLLCDLQSELEEHMAAHDGHIELPDM